MCTDWVTYEFLDFDEKIPVQHLNTNQSETTTIEISLKDTRIVSTTDPQYLVDKIRY